MTCARPDDPARDPDLRRRQLRRASIAAREALSAADWNRANAALLAHLAQRFPSPPGQCIGFCWPVRREPDVREQLACWAHAGATAVLPVILAENAALAFRAWTPASRMQTDRYGIPAPADGEFLSPDVLLLPLNAFDSAGYRIGYGGGYFDRTLAATSPRPLAIGLGFECGRVTDTLPQAHDQPLDWIVTETGAFQPHRP